MNQLDKLLEEGKFDEAITNQTRKVKWLFNNSNKLTDVVCEKTVRLIVHKLKEQTERKDNVGVSDAIEFKDWISVEDEMPPFETVVLLWIPNEISGLRTLGVRYWNDGVSWASGDKKIHGAPTHWMPLPEPPASQPQPKRSLITHK